MDTRQNDERISVRIPKDIHTALTEEAAAEDRSLNGQIIHILRQWFAARQRPAP